MLRLVLSASLLALVGEAPPTAPPAHPGVVSPARTLLPVKDVMRHIVNPAAELYWKSAGEDDTEQGVVKHVPGPQDDVRWNAAVDAAMTLQEAGSALYNACFECHGRYIPRPKNSLYGHKTPDEDFKPPM